MTAYQKAENQYKKDKANLDKAKKAMNKAFSSANLDQQMATVFNPTNKKYWLRRRDKDLKNYNAKKKKHDRIYAQYKKVKRNMTNLSLHIIL